MIIYNFKTKSHTLGRVDTSISTTKVFDDNEKDQILSIIEANNQNKKRGIIEDFGFQQVDLIANPMSKIIEDMSFEDFSKMIILISNNKKNNDYVEFLNKISNEQTAPMRSVREGFGNKK